jgi:PilZ domain
MFPWAREIHCTNSLGLLQPADSKYVNGPNSEVNLALQMLQTVLVPWYQEGLTVETHVAKTRPIVDTSKQRRFPRIRLQIPIFLRGQDASGVDFVELTKTLNISASGACIASTHMLRPDQVVQLTIPTPSPASSGLVPNETPPITAKVLRQQAAGELRLFGVEFSKPLE